MRTTLKQIADVTKMSITIVSQVINNKPCRVSKEKRKLILETAEELNYRPNLVAVGLVKGSTNIIGLAISDIRNNFFSVLAKGVEEECQKNNWNMILCNSNDKHSKDMANLQMLADKGAGGIIFGMASETTEAMAQECIEFMQQEHLPYMLVDRYIDIQTDRIVCVDHVQGGYLATSYLLKMGHKNIAYITGPSNLIDSQQRLTGCNEALGEYGIVPNQNLIAEGKYTFESGAAAVEKLLKRSVKIDAIFAFNDMMAIGAIKRLREHGIQVPQDVSIVGYDDIFMDEFLDVPLTTIKQPMKEMGRAAARQIINPESRYKNGEKRIIFEPKLVIRKSVIDRNEL
ncbi:MAG: LacI family DNA-binding transcriptional regulator [Lachnospiraceae bacterium]|nr:LacI family DNA-binding transcriptional regulator [Lachnospiraceae bacterium]